MNLPTMGDGRPNASQVLLQPGDPVWLVQLPAGQLRRALFRSYGVTNERMCVVQLTEPDGTRLRCVVVDPVYVFPVGAGEWCG